LSFRHMSEAKEEEPASLQKNARTEHGNVEFPKLCHSDRRGGTCCLQHYQRGRLGGPSLFFPHLKLWLPRPCVLCKGGYDAADSTRRNQPKLLILLTSQLRWLPHPLRTLQRVGTTNPWARGLQEDKNYDSGTIAPTLVNNAGIGHPHSW
jgi:hypothetical protein